MNTGSVFNYVWGVISVFSHVYPRTCACVAYISPPLWQRRLLVTEAAQRVELLTNGVGYAPYNRVKRKISINRLSSRFTRINSGHYVQSKLGKELKSPNQTDRKQYTRVGGCGVTREGCRTSNWFRLAVGFAPSAALSKWRRL